MNDHFLKILQDQTLEGFSFGNQLRQEVVYLIGCGTMQHFYGEDWDKDVEKSGFENE